MNSSDNKTYSVDEVRETHPRAYEKWSDHDDKLLLKMVQQGKDMDTLCAVFQRGRGAIRSRIRKLEEAEKIDSAGFSRTNHLISEVLFDWIPVLQDEDELYYFPNSLTPFMKRLYKSPAVYRWNIYKNTPTDEKIIYIGEGQRLIPDRINGYLNPGPAQRTNKRLNTCFREYILSGYKVVLEIVRFDEVSVGEILFRQTDLKNKHFRRFLEHMLITHYEHKEYSLLNR